MYSADCKSPHLGDAMEVRLDGMSKTKTTHLQLRGRDLVLMTQTNSSFVFAGACDSMANGQALKLIFDDQTLTLVPTEAMTDSESPITINLETLTAQVCDVPILATIAQARQTTVVLPAELSGPSWTVLAEGRFQAPSSWMDDAFVHVGNGIEVLVSSGRLLVTMATRDDISAADIAFDGAWHTFDVCTNGMDSPNNGRLVLDGKPLLYFDIPQASL